MEPIISVLAVSAKKAVIKYAGDLIKNKIIERWSLYRAQMFYESFLYELEKQADVQYQSADLDDLLRKIDEKDEVSSVLFDAYRRVCLSASRELGPRIIGLLTAEIVLQERSATEGEECIFQAAETLSDSDFRDFAEYVNSKQSRLGDDQRIAFETLGHTKYVIRDDEAAAELEGGYLRPSEYIDIGTWVGLWALRLKHFGLVYEDRVEQVWKVAHDSERHIDQDMRVRRTTDYLVTTRECHHLVALIERASSVT
ncbi:TPA: hypothetical protein QDB19_004909 [Burkholderia vietnamiensis]|nr:hypothetical protein [Burkholderia vietnamiensis]